MALFLLFAFLLSDACFAFPPTRYSGQHALLKRPPLAQEQQKTLAKEPEQVNTVRVTCLPDSLEIVIKADLFGIGAPVDSAELRLGAEFDDFCRATAASSGDEYAIVVGLMDCGTKHWMTEDSLVYTNLLIYSPAASPDGLIRMDQAVIPIECHYERKYSLSSSSLTPTWFPFMSTQASLETLTFDLRIMTSDWLYKRGSNVFFLGDAINIEASVRVGYHMGLRVFVSSCVATLDPDLYSVPRYVFVEHGCLVDSQLQGSRSSFLPRTHDDKLHMVIDAFRFHNEERGQLYITCQLNAVPLNDAEAPKKACTSINGRWRSADGNDFLCGQCQKPNEAGQTPSKPSSHSKFGPRGFGKQDPQESWRSGLTTTKVWEQEASVGPVLVLPAKQDVPLPVGVLPLKMGKPIYGSQWRSGMNNKFGLKKVLLPARATFDQVLAKDHKSETALSENDSPGVTPESKDVVPNDTITAAPSDANAPVKLDLTLPSNTTAVQTNLSESNDPKR
ncbi:zona pellucida sperm-binding protein 3-like [Solea solea]|uniref:zona pellucida sperm-binding protein 3-like n=1 Tax=Solea solea TaxID=90069 RepID=UPI002729E9E5|nr:zona pellucida sperm-binding protein 3-like [Solea solea]